MAELERVWSKCKECKRNTNHTVLADHRFDTNPDSYRSTTFYQIVKCDGCDNISYRTINHDVEGGYQCQYEGWVVPNTVEIYPKMELENKFSRLRLPTDIDAIFSETLSAFNEGANTLTGVGLRATIEAICNDKGITGKNLQIRINRLAAAGLISKDDAKRLHAIRFLGNDAAHRLERPKDKSIAVAKAVIEHLITTIYILDTDMARNLVTVIDRYDEFEELLNEKVQALENGKELTIGSIIGSDIRRLDPNFPYNSELLVRIANGSCTFLKVGKKAKHNNSKQEIQHYIVDR